MRRAESLRFSGHELLEPLSHYSRRYYLFVGSLLAVVVWGIYAYSVQFTTGMGVTGMRSVVSWGFYIINFVFFIGISHVGALMSAILRLSNAEWRKPITRMAEVVTAASLAMAALMPLIDLGRPDRILNTILYARLQSPLAWDFIAIGTYLTGSLIFLYLPMIPDIARCRDELTSASRVRRLIYRVLAVGWIGHHAQKEKLERAIKIMTIIIIPIAISVHTVVSWDFAMTLRIAWNSTIFGPYFVAGALFSGVATVILAMAVLTKVYHLENYISIKHFHNLAKLLLALDIIVIYFTINEFIVPAYKHLQQTTPEGQLLGSLFWGRYAPQFYFQVVGGLVVPLLIMAIPKTRTITGYLVASVLVNIGMWIERFNIVVPGLAVPQLPYAWGTYFPTWVEISIVSATFAGFALLYTVFSRTFPIVSIWEVEETATSSSESSNPSPSLTVSPHSRASTETPGSGQRAGRMTTSRRGFLTLLFSGSAGFAAGLVVSGGVAGGLSKSPQGALQRLDSDLQLARLGRSVTLEEARLKSNPPINPPSYLPPTSKLSDVKIIDGNGIVSLLYSSSNIPNLSIYPENISILLLMIPQAGIDAPPQTLPLGFQRLQVQGRPAYGRASENSSQPSQLRWWGEGARYVLFSKAPLTTLREIADSIYGHHHEVR